MKGVPYSERVGDSEPFIMVTCDEHQNIKGERRVVKEERE